MDRDPNEPFIGALTTKLDLQDIAQALGLSVDGAKKDILKCITNHFDTNPNLHASRKFEGLFNCSCCQPVAAHGNDENTAVTNSDGANILNHISTASHGFGPFSFNYANVMGSESMPQAGPSQYALRQHAGHHFSPTVSCIL